MAGTRGSQRVGGRRVRTRAATWERVAARRCRRRREALLGDRNLKPCWGVSGDSIQQMFSLKGVLFFSLTASLAQPCLLQRCVGGGAPRPAAAANTLRLPVACACGVPHEVCPHRRRAGAANGPPASAPAGARRLARLQALAREVAHVLVGVLGQAEQAGLDLARVRARVSKQGLTWSG